ncbi:snapin/pallidin family protein [Streptomyces sp. 35G-GA-8]|uniref:snapin/pallidin family protein n=1 Tax=Streptomyces sp. 35G-GA-8 TaxID=2939434 RepID=UPI00201F95CD|nr:snapin/pallidin family protein [Streptomyces sp. 35G-GA-8]MCL7377430.1 snapin/pallidin family protein [Streptomyces sp. 35G-GA-8]
MAAMQARVEQLAAQLDDARTEDFADSVSESISYQRRIARMARAVARLSTALTTQTRRADRLQQRLDDAVGITSPAVDSGDLWQQRRSDKPLPGPSGVKR